MNQRENYEAILLWFTRNFWAVIFPNFRRGLSQCLEFFVEIRAFQRFSRSYLRKKLQDFIIIFNVDPRIYFLSSKFCKWDELFAMSFYESFLSRFCRHLINCRLNSKNSTLPLRENLTFFVIQWRKKKNLLAKKLILQIPSGKIV